MRVLSNNLPIDRFYFGMLLLKFCRQNGISSGKVELIVSIDNNRNTWHHLGRVTRWTKVIPQRKEMVDTSLKLWQALIPPEISSLFQPAVLSIYHLSRIHIVKMNDEWSIAKTTKKTRDLVTSLVFHLDRD